MHLPDLGELRARWQAAERFYRRNQRLVDDSRTRMYELRKRDTGFAAGGEEAEERAADALEAEA